jgi:hypothetical protein
VCNFDIRPEATLEQVTFSRLSLYVSTYVDFMHGKISKNGAHVCPQLRHRYTTDLIAYVLFQSRLKMHEPSSMVQFLKIQILKNM